MKFKKWFIVYVIIILCSGLFACKGKNGELDDNIAAGVAATQTKQAWEAELESTRQTEQAQVPESITEPEIVHELIPGEPTELSNSYVTDFNSIDFAEEGITYGDQFIMRGKAQLDKSGRVQIAMPLDLNKYFKEDDDKTSKIFTVYITV
ncbi:MAG: hypothetical protein MUO54_03900, partial [Anaerolineales bacterium]|nr:hypothetical protein [Anaerolineales bacterium]